MVGFFQSYDLLLTPTLAEPPMPIGTIATDGPDPEAAFARAVQFTPYTAIWNLTGQPAISLPLFVKDGLPLAVQLIAGPLQDGLLLSVAGQLEGAYGWNKNV
jgi:amidase